MRIDVNEILTKELGPVTARTYEEMRDYLDTRAALCLEFSKNAFDLARHFDKFDGARGANECRLEGAAFMTEYRRIDALRKRHALGPDVSATEI